MMIIIISSVLTSTLEQTKLIFPRWSSSPIVHILFRFFLQTKSFSCIIFSSGFSTMIQSFLFSSVENEEKIFLINSSVSGQAGAYYWLLSNGIILMSPTSAPTPLLSLHLYSKKQRTKILSLMFWSNGRLGCSLFDSSKSRQVVWWLRVRTITIAIAESGFCDYYFCFAAGGQLLPGGGLARHDLWWPCKICPGTTDHRSHQSAGHQNITALFNQK